MLPHSLNTFVYCARSSSSNRNAVVVLNTPVLIIQVYTNANAKPGYLCEKEKEKEKENPTHI